MILYKKGMETQYKKKHAYVQNKTKTTHEGHSRINDNEFISRKVKIKIKINKLCLTSRFETDNKKYY